MKNDYEMHWIYVLAVIVALMACSVFVCCILVKRTNRKRRKLVEETSYRIRALKAINAMQHFYEFPNVYSTKYVCSSKQQLDSFRVESYYLTIISASRGWADEVRKMVCFNREHYDLYMNGLVAIENTSGIEIAKQIGFSPSRYVKIENDLYSKIILKPVLNPIFQVDVQYTSPKGRNFYNNRYQIDFSQFEGLCQQQTIQQEYKKSKRYQRSLMTPSLRMKVLKRDGYKCCLCGASAQNGVTLEVDHKVPIARGGLTEPSNLWTLCWDCNRGKSDKTL